MALMKLLHDKDANLEILNGKCVAVIGYGSQGAAQAQCMRDSGVNVVIGVREGGKSWKAAKGDEFEVLPIGDAVAKADVVHVLLPDEVHGPIYREEIEPNLKSGSALSCSHGFNIVYKEIVPSENVDVIMVAPKSPGTEERKAFLDGFGVPGLIAVEQDASGNARDIALGMAKAMGFTRAGVLECTFEQETYEDLFGEQSVLCGGLVELMKAGFETLTEAGYPPEMAYFECVHETKLIVDLIYEGGIKRMNEVISNTAEWGEYVTGPRVIGPEVKARMKEALAEIEDGTFARKWLEESRSGAKNLTARREELGEHAVEVVGDQIRKMFERS
jgi:ketol-acid reductoisomerase